jgi:peptidoglycan/xylan/chitin deacetylase (PgdA/CDA1 family)
MARTGSIYAVGHDVVCLCYHAISRDWPCALAVRPEQLQRQLAWLVDHGWTAATFSQAVLDPPARRTFAVTFDDAYQSVIERALPILAALDIPGTVFAPTGFMAERQQLLWPGIDHWARTPHAHELTSMDWRDLKVLADRGWEIGSHTRTHPRLDDLADEDVLNELERSREQCASQLGGECSSLAYPYGRASSRVAQFARAAGYHAAATIPPPREGSDRFRHPRLGVYRVDEPLRFRIKLAARRLYGSFLWPGLDSTEAHAAGTVRA